MFTVQPVQMPITGAAIARPELSSVQSVTAVAAAGDSSGARNDLTRDPGADSERAARLLAQLRRDPSAPAGPPPAFKANVLDMERARLLDPPDLLAEEQDNEVDAAEDEGEADPAARAEAAPEGPREARSFGSNEAPQRAYEEARATVAPTSEAAA